MSDSDGENVLDLLGALSVSTPRGHQPGARRENYFRNAAPEEKIAYKAKLKAETTDLIYDETEDLDSWKGIRPSRCFVEDGIGTIRVNRPGLTESELFPVNNETLDELVEEFEKVKKTPSNVTTEKLASLAKDYNFTSGKWMLFLDESWDEADRFWKRMAKELLEEDTLNMVKYIKTPGRDDSRDNPMLVRGKGTKISVITADFTDRKALEESERIIRSLGFRGNMKYKPDIYTHLKIFARNEFGILPSVMTTNGAARTRGTGGRRGSRGRRGRF